MSIAEFTLCIEMMDKLRAQNALLDISVATYPHGTKEFRNKLMSNLKSRASEKDESSQAVTTAVFADILSTGGKIG